MRTLILSANAGQGHNSCARAICEAFEAHGDVCVIEDTFGLISRKLSDAIAKNHEKTYREKPKQSNASYQFLIDHPKLFARRNIVYAAMCLGIPQISRCIREGGYDTVICTHALSAMILTAAIRREKFKLKTAFVATDYACSPGVNGTELDVYFLPDEELRPLFTEAGIPDEKMAVTGIPVRSAFAIQQEKNALKARFGIQPENRHLLMMCGSMGCGPIPEMLSRIAQELPENWEISVVCGTNEELLKELQNAHGGRSAIHLVGYEEDMPGLLCSADLYLTKPGGLSTAEAVAAGVPMVLVDAVAGCEENNRTHFVSTGAAITGETAQEVAEACIALMRDEERLAAMTEKLKKADASNAAERVYQKMK